MDRDHRDILESLSQRFDEFFRIADDDHV